MPFDFIEFSHYSINYLDLFNEFNAQRILSDRNLQIQYLKRWMKQLENCDNVIRNQLNTKGSILKLRLLLQSEPEIFQLPIEHRSNKILLHFRVSIANKIISMAKPESIFIPIDEFIRKNTAINWTPVDTNVDSYSKSEEPIVMVPFLFNQYHYLVIDGNHRLTFKIKNNINNIHAVIFSEQTVIEHSLFSSGFDKFYYIMLNEINHMANATYYKKANAFQLVQKSYLKDENFKF
ncbi:hypothetical protein GFC01_15375 [Desulfofundulus thermobenzoicus]|uniref:ParB/Sulfiredoxin domain-containing protein n=1 Tax=Desulfofundulus thermobenzoicus TaxID=29376 RepID=A0A6N7IWT3_9FIRM|nr:hypothetical protein [Desulfofundulus thermobenzoicus]MQL53618.1 hypothetical protein [Desulfofundulus thermobenzoicus]